MANGIVLNIDTTKSEFQNPMVQLRQGDGNYQSLDVTVTSNGEPFNLTDWTITFMGTTAGGFKIIDAASVVSNALQGQFTYTPTKAWGQDQGEFKNAYFKFVKSDETASGASFRVNVLEAVDLTAEEAKDYISVVDVMINQVKTDMDTKLSETKQTLADTQSQANTVQVHVDDLNTSINDLKTQNLNIKTSDNTWTGKNTFNLPIVGNVDGTATTANDPQAIHIDTFGITSDLKQPIGSKFVDKLNNEFSQRGINVKWYGAIGDGTTDDSASFNAAIAEARQNFISKTGSNVVIVPRGVYMINSTITLPPYVKFVTNGNTELYTTMEVTPIIHISYYDNDFNETTIKNYEKQGFSKGTTINGDVGGLVLKYVGTKDRNTNLALGIKIGDDADNQGKNLFARFDISNISVTNFGTALQFSKYNTFIIGAFKLHLESNGTDVLFGDISLTSTDTSATNSGENISFYNSIFAGATNAFLINSTYFDANFYGCSFDFNTTIFNFKRGLTTINVFGGHIENATKIASSENINTNDNWYGFAPVVNLNGTTLYLNSPHAELFATNASSTLKVDLNNVRVGSPVHSYSLYSTTPGVTATVRNFSSRSSVLPVVSKNLNPLLNSDYATENGFVLSSSNVGESWTFSTTGVPGGSYNKAIKLTGGTNSLNWGQVITPKLDLNGKNQIVVNVPIFQEGSGSYKAPTIQVSFFDSTGNKISTTVNSVSGQSAQTSDTWNFHSAFIDGVPINAKTFTVLVVIGGALENKSKWIGPLAINEY